MRNDQQPWEDLVGTWQSDSGEPPHFQQLRARTQRHTLLMLATVGLELLLTAGLVLWTVKLLLSGADLFDAATLLAAWIFWTVAARFAIHNRRGLWREEEQTTRAFLAVSQLRAHRRLATARFVPRLLLAQALALGGLLLWRRASSIDVPNALAAAGIVGGLSVLYLGWALWAQRQARAEIQMLQQLTEELGLDRPESTDHDTEPETEV